MAAKVEYCSGLRQVFDWFHLYSTSELFLLCCEVGRYTLGVLWIWNYQSFKVLRSVLMWGLAFWNCTKVRNLFQNDSWIGIGALKIKDCKHLKLKQFGGWERMCSLQQSWEIVAQCWRHSRSRRCCWSADVDDCCHSDDCSAPSADPHSDHFGDYTNPPVSVWPEN